jgi:formylglycine-generating enzyme required for sulfatase activity
MSSAPTPQERAPFSVSLPESVVKIDMVPIPGADGVKPFYMAKTETAWEAFDVYLASGPPSVAYDQTDFAADAIARPSRSYKLPDLGWGHRGYPVINVNIDSAVMFCRWLSSVTGKKFRLPTEAEWEHAARAGASAIDPAKLDEVAWYAGNSEWQTQPVGKKKPNAFGLFDMLGNVGEWAMDKDGKPVLCGPHFEDEASAFSFGLRRRYSEAWQESDPQMPKSRWWLSDGPFAGFRVVCEG